MPISGIDDAVAELERVHAMGFKSVQLLSSPTDGNARSPRTTAFWEKALELEMALSPHMSFGGVMNIGGAAARHAQWPVEAGMTQHARMAAPANTMAQLIVDGTFERFPELRFYFAEINAAIFPAALYYMDRDYLEYNSWFELELPKMPSQYMKDHALYGMVREPLAVRSARLPDRLPLELFWWGSDFPHSVGTFPHSRKYIEETFADLKPRAAPHAAASGTRPRTSTSTSTPTSPRPPPPDPVWAIVGARGHAIDQTWPGC